MTFHLSYRVNKPLDFVFDSLSDMDRFVAVHPVINKALFDGTCYRMHETLTVLGWPISFQYPATVRVQKQNPMVEMRAVVSKLVRIRLRFTILSDNESSTVHEEISITSILPVHLIMKRIFKKQHDILFSNIEKAE